MERIKIMPRHILLLALPVLVATIGGMLTSGSLEAFMSVPGYRGISPAQFFFGISLLVGLLSFSWRCLPKNVLAGIILFYPLVCSILMTKVLGIRASLFLIYGLNLMFSIGIMGILWVTFFTRKMIRIRTAAFAALSGVLQALYFQMLYTLISPAYNQASFVNNFMSAFFLFIFVGFGLSVADVIVIRKEVEEEKREMYRHIDEDDDDL